MHGCLIIHWARSFPLLSSIWDAVCRWRNQKGKIPDMDELEAKKAQLMEKLDIKREAAFEKDLILEELASLSTRLHESAAAGK